MAKGRLRHVLFIGYPATAEFIEKISGESPELCRERFEMLAGDEALIVKLKYRCDPDKKGIVDPSDEDFEFDLKKTGIGSDGHV